MICPFMSGPSGQGGKIMIECKRGNCALWVTKTTRQFDKRGEMADGQTRACAAAFMAASTSGNWKLNG